LFFIPLLQAQQKTNYRKVPVVDSAVGYASFYSDVFEGKKTANGEIFRQSKLTCAHNTMPFGTKLKVTNLDNEKSVVVRVNDRLHHRNPRLVDLSTAAAKELKFKGKGVVKVKVEVMKASENQISPPKE
jgi:rare lipoprotein A